MGLLDDAIREHLELKRRHGAAEEEVARQEQEALGPPRRGEVPQPLAPPADPVGDEVAPEEVPAAAVDPVEPVADLAPLLDEDDALLGDDGPTGGAYAAPRPDPEPAREASVYEDEPWLEESTPPPTAPPEGAAPAEEEDVLEETPEFLQETPEHDRLWFEQKPPKDFDFDQ